MKWMRKDAKTTKSKGILILSIVILAVILSAFIGYRTQAFRQFLLSQAHEHKEVKKEYYCPMHPEVKQNKPGKCPICGMKLVPVPEESPEHKHHEHEHKHHKHQSKVDEHQSQVHHKEKKTDSEHKTLYHCPMHPQYVSERSGECPICGMKLVKIETDKEAKPAVAEVEGRIPVKISPEKQQLIGVRFSYVERKRLTRTLNTVGIVDYDERRLFWVNARFDGWIEKLHVNYTGAFVRKDQPLAEIYSPELVLAQREYLISKKNSEDLISSSLQKFNLWNIPDSEVMKLDKTGKVRRTIPIYPPASGVVIEKYVIEGQRISAGENLYKLADLSYVWVLGDVYEYDVRSLKVGQRVKVTSPYHPGEIFYGKIDYIYPYLKSDTRTNRIRFEIENKGLKLRPQMYVNLEIEIDHGVRLSVPSSAVLDSGKVKYVFVDVGDGYFEPREVKIGVKAGDYYEVLEGLKEGEKVVTSALFLIDSESSLRYAIELMKESKAVEHKH